MTASGWFLPLTLAAPSGGSAAAGGKGGGVGRVGAGSGFEPRAIQPGDTPSVKNRRFLPASPEGKPRALASRPAGGGRAPARSVGVALVGWGRVLGLNRVPFNRGHPFSQKSEIFASFPRGEAKGARGRAACRGRCPHRPARVVDGAVWKRKGRRWVLGWGEPSCRCVGGGVGRDDVGIVPYICAGARAIHRAGVVPWGATFRLFVSATGVDMQLSGPGALIWSAPWVGADHGG